MGYGGWGLWSRKSPEYQEFSERGWRRKSLPEWDSRWQQLSVPARSALIADMKAPPKGYAAGSPNAGSPVTSHRAEVVKELTDAGFIRVVPSQKKDKPDRVIVQDAVADFRTRVKALFRLRMLDPAKPGDLDKFINVACYPSRVVLFVSEVLRDAGIETNLTPQSANAFLTSARWPELVLKAIKDPVAERVLNVIRDADRPVPLDELTKRVESTDPAAVRAALDKLITHLAVFEDVDGKTLALEVGLLPEVRQKFAAAATRTDRPPLVVCQAPREIGPESGPLIDDLRGFLLEVASEPPKLRQDGEIFSKEKERFYHALEAPPEWLVFALKGGNESRLNQAYSEASELKFVKEQGEDKGLRLQLTPRGRAWLTAETKEQYTQVYEGYRAVPKQESSYYDYEDEFEDEDELDSFSSPYRRSWSNYYSYSVLSDRRFLGSAVSVAPIGSGKNVKKNATPTVNDIKALREAIGREFEALPEGVYHRLDSVIERLVFRDKNVLLLGHAQEEVRVFDHGQPVPALEEVREQVGRLALNPLVLTRLIPLGCLRAAIDADKQLCIARTPRLGAYFGFAAMPEEAGASAGEGAKVVVQPDFSVVVIGLSTAALAELAPFCDRSGKGGKGPGASVLKITRESVTRAIAQGLKPQQILDRLRKHASHEPPANVLREVRDWGNWVKSVSTAKVTVLRCPDSETADRVIGALKGQVERLNDTTLALNRDRLEPADRKKLKDHGILIGTSSEGPAVKTAKKKVARRKYY